MQQLARAQVAFVLRVSFPRVDVEEPGGNDSERVSHLGLYDLVEQNSIDVWCRCHTEVVLDDHAIEVAAVPSAFDDRGFSEERS